MLSLVFQLLIYLLNPNLSICEGDTRNAIISALEKATDYLETHYDEINLDGVLGYCMMQGQLFAALEKWNSDLRLESERERVARLQKKSSAAIEKAKRALGESNPYYYKVFSSALSPEFWKPSHQWLQTDPSAAVPLTNSSSACLGLDASNVCISSLLGTGKDGGDSCTVPDICRSFATGTHCTNYELSHQVFYFMFAEMKGCLDPLFLNAQYYKNLFCTAMMQININAEKQEFSHFRGDLFTENILFCGFSGFSDFYQPRWLDIILNWQKPEKGCFWMYADQSESFPQKSKSNVQESRRVKRWEKILKDGCSAHNTGVAVGTLAGFLYYGF
ncbi:UPF0764 protein C16orf89 homolog [Hemicordylus capensis]|uniref:UPF0764 protein C16orf89 homolog n=1 Tax=Hemicordylus capensis TaxID=884348 RepID=UPI002302E7AF|nr:UPF0764 protein C16orf89 homolog [Hemicordylus capensis]